MNPAPAFRHCSALLVLTVASIAGTSARAVELTPNSPFAPPSSSADTSATTANSPLELHGILSTPEGYKFNLCDQAGHVNVWIGLNATGQKFVVRSHDVTHHRVTVEYQGRELTLSLAQPNITAMSMSQQYMQQPQMGGMPPQLQPGAVSASPEDERMRLERIAEEIRRRRAMRAAAQQQPQQESPPRNEQYPQPPRND
jgi:hypothetical protein